MADVTSIVQAVASGGSTCLLLVACVIGRRKVSDLHDDVKANTAVTVSVQDAVEVVKKDVATYNDLKLGELGAAEESRRIQAKEPADRTHEEWQHIKQQPTPGA